MLTNMGNNLDDFEKNAIGLWIAAGRNEKEVAEILSTTEKQLKFWRMKVRGAKHKKRKRDKMIEQFKLELVDFLEEI